MVQDPAGASDCDRFRGGVRTTALDINTIWPLFKDG